MSPALNGARCERRVGPARVRPFRNVSTSGEAVYLCVGGADGYAGRDGMAPECETHAPQEARS
jgi:hypothetical protein